MKEKLGIAVKKVLTPASHCGILLKLSLRGEAVELKSGLKRTKKVLDKRISV